MTSTAILILLSSLVIFSYLFDIVSRKTNIPSVLLLLFSGMIIHYIAEQFNVPMIEFSSVLPVIGTIGLILIVLEGALDLKYSKSKSKIILSALGSALFILLLTSAGIAFIFMWTTGCGFRLALLNAIPFSVISSSVAIPSVRGLIQHKKEFIIYESSFSDILGIIIFNFISVNSELQWTSFISLGADLLLVIVLALALCFGLVFLMRKLTYHVKFFLVLAVLILMYAIGKHFHLPSLFIVLALGLFIANLDLVVGLFKTKLRLPRFGSNLLYSNFEKDMSQFNSLASESAFLIRTFFFLVFGYTLDPEMLLHQDTLITGSLILAATYIIRAFYLRVVAKSHLWPEVLVSPRGLISVLLFISISPAELIFSNGNGLLLFIIIASGLMMTIGLIISGRKIPMEQDSGEGH